MFPNIHGAAMILIVIVTQLVSPLLELSGALAKEADDRTIVLEEEIQALTMISDQMIVAAMSDLSEGWAGMDLAERETFLKLFDPSSTGDIDETFVQTVSDNYAKIRRRLILGVPVLPASAGGPCAAQRLYYTDLLHLHVCPYFFEEPNEIRKARTLIHEAAHMALLVRDRPYYRPTSDRYRVLTPRGPKAGQWLLIGPFLRELAAKDTLYHADAYAHFALAASSLPGAEQYGQSTRPSTPPMSAGGEKTRQTGSPFGDSWN